MTGLVSLIYYAAKVAAQGGTEMKRFGILAGAVSGVAAIGLVIGGALPSNAAQLKTVAASNTQSVTYVKRYFNHSNLGYQATAVLPKTWRHVVLGQDQARFTDPAANRMIRFDTTYNYKISTVTALKNKVAALKGTRGLHVVGTSTVTMRSTSGQGPLTVSTLVYTYKSGNTTRWVATRYVGLWGVKSALAEISTAGALSDSKLLGAVINNATVSLTLAG